MSILDVAEEITRELNSEIDRTGHEGILQSWIDPTYLDNVLTWTRLYKVRWAKTMRLARTRNATRRTSYPLFWVELKENQERNADTHPFAIYIRLAWTGEVERDERIAQFLQMLLRRSEGWVNEIKENRQLRDLLNHRRESLRLKDVPLPKDDIVQKAFEYIKDVISPLDNVVRDLAYKDVLRMLKNY